MGSGEWDLHAPEFPWHHRTPVSYSLFWRPQFARGMDWGSVRRGRQIYTEVFAPCHSLDLLSFRHLQEFMSVEEAKELAAECEVVGEPDDEGNVAMRPAGLMDHLPAPYPNAKAAAFANNGANPPDLSHITKGRHGGENYVYALLTGYDREPAAGVPNPGGTLSWNPYFHGGWIGMPKPLSEEQVEYEDGTPASVAQMAKDVSVFLAWCAEPWMDERKYWSLKMFTTLGISTIFTAYWARTRVNITKYRRVQHLKRGRL